MQGSLRVTDTTYTTDANVSSLSASQAVITDASKNLISRAIYNKTSVGTLEWTSSAADIHLITKNTLAYWNGAYTGTSSNLEILGTVTKGTWNATTIGVAYGGTGATNASGARTNLGLGTMATETASNYIAKSGGTMTGAFNTANNTWNTIGDDAYLGDINKAGHIGIQGKNGNTGIFFTTYNQTTKTTGGAITWDGSKFSITSTTAIDASISGNAATADSTKWLMNRGGSTVTISDGLWTHQQTGSGGTNTTTVWHQQWKQSGLTYTPSGGSATTLTDTADMVLWLAQSTTSNLLSVNMAIDGIIYAMGGFKGDLNGQASTVARATFGNSSNGEHNANNIKSNGMWYYTSNGPATTLGATTGDGALYSQAYSTSWTAQIAQDYRDGAIFVRGLNNGTWKNWYAIPKFTTTTGGLGGTTQPVYIDTNGELQACTAYGSASVNYATSSGSCTGNAANVTGTVAINHGGTGATTAANARTNLGLGSIATYNAAVGTNDTWGLVPVIGSSDGVMEVGKYIDFHTTDGNTADYDVRIAAATTGLTISGTTTGTFSGNLSGNASTATKATQDADGDDIRNRYFRVYNTGYIGNSSTVTVNDLAAQGPAYGMIYAATDNPLGSAGWVHVLNMGWGKANTSWIGQIALHTDGTTMYFRGNGASAISGKGWNTILSDNLWRKYIFANKNINRSTLTVTDSGWAVTSGTDVFGLSFKDTALQYTPSGGSATASSDTGDWRAWLTCAAASNVVQLHMRIDGTWQAEKFIGALQGNATTATKWANTRTLTIGNKGQSVDGSSDVSWSLADIGAAPSSTISCTAANIESALGINFITNTGSLNSNGWKTLGGRSAGAKIAISYANASQATWNSSAYSSSIVFGCNDTTGLLDCGFNSPVVTFGGGYVNGSTDNDPTWYFKLLGTSAQTYTFPSTSKTLAASDGSNASGTWGISITGNAANVTGTVAIDHGGTGATTAAGARANLGTWALVPDSFSTLMPADGTTNNWIKIGTSNTSYGIIPSAAGNAGSGHNYIGTSTWYWKYAYIDEIYGVSLHLNNRGTNTIYNGPNDAANGAGGALNNLVFSSWYGVSFTTSCTGQTYTNTNAVSINCRNGNVFIGGTIEGIGKSNTLSTYGGFNCNAVKGGYAGIYIGTAAGGLNVIAQNNSYQGLYNESKGKWITCYVPTDNTIRIGNYTIPDLGGFKTGSIYLTDNVIFQSSIYSSQANNFHLYPCYGRTDSAKGYYIAFQSYLNDAAYPIGKIYGSGNNLIFEGTCQAYSSRYVKHNIQPLIYSDDIIDRLTPVTFIYNNDASNKQHLGFIYEDTVNIVPQICLDDGQTKTINYAELTPLLLKEIQNLRKRVKTLEEQLSQN